MGDRSTQRKGVVVRRYSDLQNEAVGVDDDDDDDDPTPDVWDSGLSVLDNPTIHVPEQVERVCTAIQRQMPGTEFGILFKGEWKDDGFHVDPEEYIIPEQEVSAAHIDYEEDLKKYRDNGFVVNIHSHPNSGRSAGFSGVDDDHINSHFEAALLYAGRAEAIVDGIVNVTIEDGIKVQVDPDVDVHAPEEALPDVDLDNIEERTYNTTVGNHTSGDSKKGSQIGRRSYSWPHGYQSRKGSNLKRK